MAANEFYAPIIVHGIIVNGKSEVRVQMRRKGSSEITEKITGVVRDSRLGKWKIVPVIFPETILGVTYQFRVIFKSLFCNITRYSRWQDQVAGDETPPAMPEVGHISVTRVALGLKLSISNAYIREGDFAGFQWVVASSDVGDPLESDEIMEPVKMDYVMQYPGTGSSYLVYVWVRAVDTSGNHSAWQSTSISVDNDEVDGVFVFRGAIVMG